MKKYQPTEFVKEIREKLNGKKLEAPVGTVVEWWEPTTGKVHWRGSVVEVSPTNGKLVIQVAGGGRGGRRHFTNHGVMISMGQQFMIPRLLRVVAPPPAP